MQEYRASISTGVRHLSVSEVTACLTNIRCESHLRIFCSTDIHHFVVARAHSWTTQFWYKRHKYSRIGKFTADHLRTRMCQWQEMEVCLQCYSIMRPLKTAEGKVKLVFEKAAKIIFRSSETFYFSVYFLRLLKTKTT